VPRIPVHTIDTAPEPSRDVLKGLAARFGKVLNIHGEMAHSPAVLHGYAALQEAISSHGSFEARTRQAIALAVGTVDDCAYCQAAHTAGGRAAGLTEAQMLAARSGAEGLPDRLAALLAIARAYTANVGEVPEDLWRQGLAAGWSDAELAEVSIHVTVNLLTNYFNHFVHTELDFPAAPEL
jgi:AhpD family alkylhydroperoxidase